MKERCRQLDASTEALVTRLAEIETSVAALESARGIRPPNEREIRQPLLGHEGNDKQRIVQAAWEYENALFNQVPIKYPGHDAGGDGLLEARNHHMALLRANKWYYKGLVVVVLLTFLEVPPWCHKKGSETNGMFAFKPGTEWCAVPHHGDPMLSGIPYLPPALSLAIEIVTEAIILWKFYLEYSLEKEHFMPLDAVYNSHVITKCGVICAIGSILDTAVFTCLHQSFRLTWIFRPGLLFLTPGVQHTFHNIFNKRILGEFVSVGAFFIGVIVLFAWVGVTLFLDDNAISYEADGETVHANKGLETFPKATYSMFVGGVTGDFIDVFLPSFASCHVIGLLWMLYLLLTQVLFKNLVMDTLVSAYLKGGETEMKGSAEIMSQTVGRVFRLLSNGKPYISEADFLAFVAKFGESPRVKCMPPEAAKLAYEEFGQITGENFIEACLILQHQFWITPRSSCLLDKYPQFRCLVEYVWEPEDKPESLPKFDHLMNNILLANLVVIIAESVSDLTEWNNSTFDLCMNVIEMLFSFVYVGEVAVKLCVKSWGEYWSQYSNKFDFFTTWLLVITSFLQSDKDLAKYANILRLLRLLRILKQAKRFPSVLVMVATISRILAAAGEILSLMGTFFFFFSCLAMNMFGGWLYKDNPLLEETEYAKNKWFFLNFNDMFTTTMTWFVQILCEYVPAYAEAIQAASPKYGDYAWYLFLLFYISTAAIMYELLLAFTVEVFMEVRKEADKESESGSESESEDEDHGAEEHAEKHAENTPEQIVDNMTEHFYDRGITVHCAGSEGKSFQGEVKEAYEEACKKTAKLHHHGHVYDGDNRPCQAAWVFENGVYNQLPRSIHDGSNAKLALVGEADWAKEVESALDLARRQHIKALNATRTYNKAIICLIALTLVEVPAWCHEATGNHDLSKWQAGDTWCRLPTDAEVDANLNLSGIAYLPPLYAFLIEVVVEFLIIRKFLHEYWLERDHFKKQGLEYNNPLNMKLGFIFAIGSALDTLAFMIFRQPFRLTFIFRSGLLCLLPGVQRLAARIFNRKMAGEFGSVAVFFVATVLFFAWIALTVFRDISTDGVNEGFETLPSAIYTMFIAGITEGFTDIFQPTVTEYRYSAFLWLAFLLLTQVLFLNLVIDAFVLAYMENSEELTEDTAKIQADAMLETFRTLSHDGHHVDRDTFLKFVVELNRSPRMNNIDDRAADFIHKEYGVTKHNFCDICAVLKNRLWMTFRDSSFVKDCPRSLEWLPKMVVQPRDPDKSSKFDEFMNWVLLVNMLLVFAESWDTLSGSHFLSKEMKITDMIFTVIYVIEVGVKLYVKSFPEYWSTMMNKFDFFTTWLLLGTTVAKYLPGGKKELSQYANVLRLFRLARVVKKLKQYKGVQFMISTIVKMTLACGDIFQLLGVLLFMFTTFAVNFFGGVLYEGNVALKGTDYAEKHFVVFNFNDHVMAFATWFTQLLCEYSPEMAEALFLAASWGELAWYIFPLFYLIGVAILFEILKAFTIETFLGLKEEEDEEESGENEKKEEEKLEKRVEEEESHQLKVIERIKDRLKHDHDQTLHCREEHNPKMVKELRQIYVCYEGEEGHQQHRSCHEE
jgi:hypothetical protein